MSDNENVKGDLPSTLSGANVSDEFDRLMSSRVHPDTRMQCKVCWYIYDPAEGCPEAGIEPGTPFADITNTWGCPDCGHPKSSFLPADDDLG